MYYGLLALLTRALRMDARQLRNHLFRLAFVGFIYLCLLTATFQSAMLGAPGLTFFSQIAWLNALFITCAGIGFFSSAITEEKEEDTIGLLQMAGLNHLGILFGKSTSRLIQVMLLLVVQFPFMLLAVTLGGVTTQQIIAAYVDLMAYTVLLANVALVSSVVFQRGGAAAAFTTLLMVLYGVIPKVAAVELKDLQVTGWTKSIWWQSLVLTLLEWIQDSCVYYKLSDVMMTGFNEPFLTKQVISNVGVGVFCFGLAWLLFGPYVNSASQGNASRGAVLKSTTRMKFLSPGRCWTYPFVWKDFQFIGGGYLLLVGKFMAYISLFLVLMGVAEIPSNSLGIGPSDVLPVYSVTLLAFLVLESCVYASRIFHDEIRLQTMSSLLMLPRSIPYIGYSKAIGCALGLVPVLTCLVFAVSWLPQATTGRFIANAIDARFWAIVMSFLIFLHLIALLSLFLKWGALPAAIFLMGPVSVCCPVWQFFMVIADSSGVRSLWGELPATISVWVLTGLVCFVFQMMIAARLQELGTRHS
ncbi:hypothetical protein [Schlesneria paludicola]|uniref:hypothetical protein n=1 Tax=Schlesneria paludicola TaxID=360056 RepID=UPI00029AD671|nr:hypothetical protein [Schlesneria paludicola]